MSVMVPMPVLMHMRVTLDVAAAREHEDVPARTHDLDVRAVELRQHRRGHNLIDRAQHRLAQAEVKRAIERADELVQFVRGEEHRDAALAADLAYDIDRDFLMPRIEHDQRLAAEQKTRGRDER